MCEVSSFMCQIQLSCVKFMFHFDSNQTKFLDQKQTDSQTDTLLLDGSSPTGVNHENISLKKTLYIGPLRFSSN